MGALNAQPDGSAVRCHVCGRYFSNLAQHARLAHRLDADDYRERFGLNRHTPLVAPWLSERHAALARARDQARYLTPIRVRPGDPRPPHRAEGRARDAAAAQARRRITVACAACGRPVETYPHRRQQATYCRTCGVERRRERHRLAEQRRLGRSGVPAPASRVDGRLQIAVACARCGTPIVTAAVRAYTLTYCPACGAQRRRERHREEERRRRVRLRAKRADVAPESGARR